jgi:hypothetical protein
VGFEITIPVFEGAKRVHALNSVAMVIGSQLHYPTIPGEFIDYEAPHH